MREKGAGITRWIAEWSVKFEGEGKTEQEDGGRTGGDGDVVSQWSRQPPYAVVSGLFGVSSHPPPEVALRRAEKTKFEKYSEGVRSRPDIRFIPLQSRNLVLSAATPRLF
jgi:hypothetical protein